MAVAVCPLMAAMLALLLHHPSRPPGRLGLDAPAEALRTRSPALPCSLACAHMPAAGKGAVAGQEGPHTTLIMRYYSMHVVCDGGHISQLPLHACQRPHLHLAVRDPSAAAPAQSAPARAPAGSSGRPCWRRPPRPAPPGGRQQSREPAWSVQPLLLSAANLHVHAHPLPPPFLAGAAWRCEPVSLLAPLGEASLPRHPLPPPQQQQHLQAAGYPCRSGCAQRAGRCCCLCAPPSCAAGGWRQ